MDRMYDLSIGFDKIREKIVTVGMRQQRSQLAQLPDMVREARRLSNELAVLAKEKGART